MKSISLLLIAILILSSGGELSAQINTADFNELNGLQKKDKRLVMVLIGTEWCRYCKAMKQTILRDKSIAGSLEHPVYAVFLNAEEKSDIHFADRLFRFKSTGVNTGVHELAEALGSVNGQLTYPSLCFLNEKNEIIYQHEGYLNAASLVTLLDRLTKL